MAITATFYADSKIKINDNYEKIPYFYFSNYSNTLPPYNCNTSGGYTVASASVTNIGVPDYYVVNPTSALWVRYNNSLVGKWAEIYNRADNIYDTVYEFENGDYLAAKKNPSDYDTRNIDVKYCRYDGLVYYSAGWAIVASDCPYCCFTVFNKSDGHKVFQPMLGVYDNNNSIFIIQAHYAEFVNWGELAVDAPTYTWQPFEKLTGNQGRYSCNLTKIDQSAIGDPSIENINYTTSNFTAMPSQSSLLPFILNASLNEPVTVAWSGDNWLEMTIINNPTPDTGDYLCELKFRYALTGGIIYSYTSPVHTANAVKYLYLSFIVDNENEVAIADLVEFNNFADTDKWIYGGENPTESEMHALWLWLQGSITTEEPDTPYDDGSEDNGGTGGFIHIPDNMNMPDSPSEGGLDLGFFTIYNFSSGDKSKLTAISDFLWSDDILANFKKYFSNMSDNIMSLYILPYTPANLPTKNFTAGKYQSNDITGCKYLVSRYVDIDMGSIRIDPTWTSYLDYSPYTKFSIYLPGVGVQAIDTDDVMSPPDNNGNLTAAQGSTLSLIYRLDLATGMIVAFVLINGNIKYRFSGKVGATVPISGANYNSMVSGFISGIAGLASTIATGGLTAPLGAAAIAGTIAAQKPDTYRSGNLSGEASAMAGYTPYLIITIPNKPKLIGQQNFTGFPSYKSGLLSAFEGYTEVIDAHINDISCTDAEREKILSLLKGGVIL